MRGSAETSRDVVHSSGEQFFDMRRHGPSAEGNAGKICREVCFTRAKVRQVQGRRRPARMIRRVEPASMITTESLRCVATKEEGERHQRRAQYNTWTTAE